MGIRGGATISRPAWCRARRLHVSSGSHRRTASVGAGRLLPAQDKLYLFSGAKLPEGRLSLAQKRSRARWTKLLKPSKA